MGIEMIAEIPAYAQLLRGLPCRTIGRLRYRLGRSTACVAGRPCSLLQLHIELLVSADNGNLARTLLCGLICLSCHCDHGLMVVPRPLLDSVPVIPWGKIRIVLSGNLEFQTSSGLREQQLRLVHIQFEGQQLRRLHIIPTTGHEDCEGCQYVQKLLHNMLVIRNITSMTAYPHG